MRDYPEPGRYGRLHALTAVTAYRFGSLERCVNHLVRSSLALGAVELTDAMAAWGWHNLAMAYSYTGFHGYANGAIEKAREVAAAVGLPASDFVAPGIRLRHALSLDQRGDTDACLRVLRDLVEDCKAKAASGELAVTRPINRSNYGYAAVRMAALGYRRVLDDIDPRPLLRDGGSRRADDLRSLGRACFAIAAGRPIEAVARLETAIVSDETAGAAEMPRLRALAHVATGDYASAYAADRQAYRIASADIDRMRDLFMDGVPPSSTGRTCTSGFPGTRTRRTPTRSPGCRTGATWSTTSPIWWATAAAPRSASATWTASRRSTPCTGT